MQPSPPRPSAEALLAHVEWVRRLARLLVADAQDAADVEQETWRQALERPPEHAGQSAQLRRWLAAVARNVARKLVRSRETRERHERGVAAAAISHAHATTSLSAASAAHEVTARAELHRRVVDAVLALEEIYKAPLLLRFFDDLPAQEVARRLGVPIETARTRIKRGLALVRERLGRELGVGDDARGQRGRSDWLAALAPLLVPRGAAASVVTAGSGAAATATAATGAIAGLVVGGAFMSKLAKVAVGIVVAVAALFGSYKLWIEPRVPADPVAGASNGGRDRLPEPAEVADLTPAPATATTVREPVDGAKSESAAPTTAAAALGAIEGQVLDPAGRPVAGALVVLERPAGSSIWNRREFTSLLRQVTRADVGEHTWRAATSGADGSFRFDATDPNSKWALGALHDPLGTGWNDAVAFTGEPALAKAAIVLRAGVVVFGVVRDELGTPMAGVGVTVLGATKPPDDPAAGFTFEEFMDTALSAEDGSYRSLPLPWRHAKVHALASWRSDLAQLDLPWEELPGGATEVRRDLTMTSLAVLRGRILGPDGKPARLAQTIVPRLGADARRTQSKGTIAAVAFAEDPRSNPALVARLGTNEPGLVFLDSDHLYGTLSLQEDRYEIPLRHAGLRYVAIVARDVLLGVAEIPQPPTAPDVTIDPGLLPERSLVHGLRVHFRDARDGAPLEGVQVHAIAITRDPEGRLGMSVLNFGPPKEFPPDRELELPLMPCSVEMHCAGFAAREFAIDARRAGSPTELTIDFTPAGPPRALHVEDEGGEPIAGATIRAYRGDDHEAAIAAVDVPTDEHGDSVLEGLPDGELTLIVQRAGYVPAVTRASSGSGDAADDVVLERGYELVLQVRLPDGSPARYGQVVVTNAANVPLYDDEQRNGGLAALAGRKLRLTDGTYAIRCSVPGAFEGTTTFIAAPGATVEVKLAPIE